MIYGNTALSEAAALQPKTQTGIRAPRASDGPSVWRLIENTPSLDKNSLYCNLLQASHFAATCAIAERDGALVGWMSGYVPPDQPDTLFVWQICVGPEARGEGLARRLVGDVLTRPSAAGIRHIACTITEDNTASWALFGSIARALGAQMAQSEHFSKAVHFDGAHDSEFAVTIGPIQRDRAASLAAA